MAIIERRTIVLPRSYYFITQSNFSFDAPYQIYNGVTDILRKGHGVLHKMLGMFTKGLCYIYWKAIIDRIELLVIFYLCCDIYSKMSGCE